MGIHRRESFVNQTHGDGGDPSCQHRSILTCLRCGRTLAARECPRQADDDLDGRLVMDDPG